MKAKYLVLLIGALFGALIGYYYTATHSTMPIAIGAASGAFVAGWFWSMCTLTEDDPHYARNRIFQFVLGLYILSLECNVILLEHGLKRGLITGTYLSIAYLTFFEGLPRLLKKFAEPAPKPDAPQGKEDHDAIQ